MSLVLTFDYNLTYDPPFPEIEIEIDGYGVVPSKRIVALVDSGADSSMLPLQLLQSVGAAYKDSRQMRGVAGGVQVVDRYLIGVTIGAHVIPAVHVVAHQYEAIVGRDVLNELSVKLNGPASVVEIEL